jgi:hypothetical protein
VKSGLQSHDEPKVSNKSIDAIVGKWAWGPEGNTAELQVGGRFVFSNGTIAKWECLDARTRKYRIVWPDGAINWATMSLDGNVLNCRHNKGSWVSKRIKDKS